MKKFLLEDLQAGDLVDVVKPTIEIDTFKPKLDDKNKVVVFFVDQENPAYDLSRFIEFSSKHVLDTEVSPAPNAAGDYLVFVEFSHHDFAEHVYNMMRCVSYLCDRHEWFFRAYGKKGKLEVV